MLVAIKARYEALDSFVQDLESTIAAPKFEKFNNKTAIRRGNNK